MSGELKLEDCPKIDSLPLGTSIQKMYDGIKFEFKKKKENNEEIGRRRLVDYQ